MAKKHTPLIVGNWKMNPTTVSEAKKLFITIRKGIARKRMKATVALAIPFPYLSVAQSLSPSKRIELVAQDVFPEPKGTYTGEVSTTMLKSVGVSSVIIGHSERRALGETDEAIAAKVSATIGASLTAIVCVGERDRDAHGDYFNFVEAQVKSLLKAAPKNKLRYLVIAYEPIWAISKGDGKGRTATAEDAHEMKLFIQKVIASVHGRSAVAKIRIIYGGSANSKNAAELLRDGEVDGLLPGGASLKPAEFIKIIDAANEHAKK